MAKLNVTTKILTDDTGRVLHSFTDRRGVFTKLRKENGYALLKEVKRFARFKGIIQPNEKLSFTNSIH